jgi:5-methylthioadenosine/S-adenosylhomocysteine deaminase
MEASSSNAALLDAIQRSATDPQRRLLLRGGYVLSMDPAIGNLVGDVLIEGSSVAAIRNGGGIEVDGAIEIDTVGSIVMPGMIDSHLHAWEGQLRGLAPDLSLDEYTQLVHYKLAPHYRADDMLVGNFVTALQCLNAGVTCMIDNSHNARTAEHSNGAVEGLRRAGIRAVHASGAPIAGDWNEQWPMDLHRLRSEYFSSEDQLLTLRMFAASPDLGVWEFANKEELWISTEMGGWFWNDDLPALMTGRHTFNHCSGMPPEAWAAIRDIGVKVNVAPRSDTTFGIGPSELPVDHALRHEIVPGLSMDNEVCYGIDMFFEMRMLLHLQRAAALRRSTAGENGPPPLRVSDVLNFATVGGAINAGLDHRIGSLTPGKAADVVVLRTEAVNTTPLAAITGAAVSFVDPSNVDTVFVDGQVRKWGGSLVSHDLHVVRKMAEESREVILQASGVAVDRFSSTLA